MNAMTQIASLEVSVAYRSWGVGGSDLHPPKMPKRARARRKWDKSFAAEFKDVFEEALEHVDWCRRRGMTPQEVIKSVRPRVIVAYTSNWRDAITAIEDEIRTIRSKGAGQ